MNTYNSSRNFFDFIFESSEAKIYEIALYFFLIDLGNRLGWKEFIDIPTRLTMAGCKIGSYSIYKRTLENLAKWNFIDWVYKAKNDTYAANVIKLNCLDKNDEAVTKALNKAMLMHYRSNGEAGASTINNKTYKPYNLKTFNYMDIFFEKEDFERYRNLKADNQKLIKENLKIILKRNFELLSIHDLSQVEFGIKFRRETDLNLKDLEEKVLDDIHYYFGLKEVNNLRLLNKVDEFVKYLSQSNQIDFFNENFSYYQQYKDMTGQTPHGIENFIGKKEIKYEDGAWQSESFKTKLKNFENSLGQKPGRNGKPDLSGAKFNVMKKLGYDRKTN